MRVAIDVGGTFTDAIAFDPEGGWVTSKVPTTPHDLSEGFLGAFDLVRDGADVEALLHGTTVLINAILTGRFPNSVLITTSGFRDVLEIMRADRKDLFDIEQTKPRPMVPRERRLEVLERIAADGSVVESLADDEIERVVAEVEALAPEAVAVCLLCSYINPEHERRLGTALRERLGDTYVSLSHEVLPVYREFERTSTTVVNALAQPLMDQYLDQVVSSLSGVGFGGRFLIMQSNGGLAEPVEVRERPVWTLFSGPAGGVISAAYVGRVAGVRDVLNLDMGGTSCDVSAVTSGDPDRVSAFEVAGYPVTVSSIDIVTVGAGGGSIAWIDPGGALQVGPDSAGAVPGPACYARGGTQPTVTDAAVVLGRYAADIELGGHMAIDADRAQEAVGPIAAALDMSVEEAAGGILRLVNVNMANALREVSVERGRDPRAYALVAAGGAGPAHGFEVADELGIPEVLIPPFPGAASAQGMLLADVRRDQVRTIYRPLRSLGASELATLVREVAEETAGRLAYALKAAEAQRSEIEVLAAIDLRYAGQAYEITIPLDLEGLDPDALEEAFHEAHASRYGHSFPGETVELINLRAAAIQRVAGDPTDRPTWLRREARRKNVHWGGAEGWVETPIVSRAESQETRFEGPAIIEQPDATIVVPVGVISEPAGESCLRLYRERSSVRG